MCVLTGDPTQPFLPHGEIMAASPMGYLLTPLIQSRIDAVVGMELERTVHLQGANVVVSMVDTSGKLSQTMQFTALFSGSVAPLGTVNVAFEAIPAALLNVGTTTEMNANVVVFGTLGGGRIDGEPFDFPVTVCTNCTLTGNPCNPSQH